MTAKYTVGLEGQRYYATGELDNITICDNKFAAFEAAEAQAMALTGDDALCDIVVRKGRETIFRVAKNLDGELAYNFCGGPTFDREEAIWLLKGCC